METYYEVYLGNQAVGKVQLRREGLYNRVICRCIVPGDSVFRLYAVMASGRENLGVLIPDGDGVALDKKISAKRMHGEGLRFIVSSGAGQLEGTFVPICPEEPFAYIDRLKSAFLTTENGTPGIRIKEHPEAV